MIKVAFQDRAHFMAMLLTSGYHQVMVLLMNDVDFDPSKYPSIL
jgi:hypothetical protein